MKIADSVHNFSNAIHLTANSVASVIVEKKYGLQANFSSMIQSMMSSAKNHPSISISRTKIATLSTQFRIIREGGLKTGDFAQIVKKEVRKVSEKKVSGVGVEQKSAGHTAESSHVVEPSNDAIKHASTDSKNPMDELSSLNLMGQLKALNGAKSKTIVAANGDKYLINDYTRGQYNGPNSEDFSTRLELLSQAAFKHVGENGPAKDGMEKLEKHYKKQLDTQCRVKIETMVGRDTEAAQAHYAAANKDAVKLMAQYATDIVALINKTMPPEVGKPKLTLNHLQQLEKEIVKARGRPTIVNVFTHLDKTYVSMQKPILRSTGSTTTPSSIRDREGLSNYVETSLGIIREDGKPELLFQGVRHSSYPPIAIADRFEREKIAAKNCKQSIIDDANRLFANKDLKPGDTIVVPKRVMMLFTAKAGDFARDTSLVGIGGKWKGESETTQLIEQVNALNMYRDRTIEATVNGVKVKIRVDVSHMNLGTNAQATNLGLGKLPNAAIQASINARGFEEFHNETFDYLEKKIDERQNEGLKKSFDEYKKVLNSGEISTLQKELDTLKESLGPRIAGLYEELEKEHNKTGAKHGEQQKLRAGIDNLEKPIYEAYKKLNRERARIFKNNKEAIGSLEADIRDNLISADPKVRAFFENFVKGQAIYITKGYEKPDSVMDFQTIYLQQQFLMDTPASFNCKSGEDRTGLQEVFVQSQAVYFENHGVFALSDSEKNEMHESITGKVCQYSASQDNTFQNSNARGLQIGAQVAPASILPKANKLGAQMAKSVFKLAKKLNPSAFFAEQTF